MVGGSLNGQNGLDGVCKTMHGIKQNCHQGMIWVAQGLHDPSNPELGSVANLLGMIFEFLA